MIYGAVPPITIILLRVLCYHDVRNQRGDNVWCKKRNPIRLFNRLEALCYVDLCARTTLAHLERWRNASILSVSCRLVALVPWTTIQNPGCHSGLYPTHCPLWLSSPSGATATGSPLTKRYPNLCNHDSQALGLQLLGG